LFVDASYGGLLFIDEHCSITDIVITLSGTTIFVKTRIQSKMALSSTESETMARCDAGKIVKYMRKLFIDLRLAVTLPTPICEDNQGTILVTNHRHPVIQTRHMDIHYVATQEWIHQGLIRLFKVGGKVNPSEAISGVLYHIFHRCHFDLLVGY
jgi:hypothetical protein